MTNKKGNRKQKWRNITLNQANIDEYLLDLYNETTGNYITQGVSFNKDDSYQMTLLRNALIAHGSFSGFIKSLLYSHFEKHGKLDDTIWQPNRIENIEEQNPTGEDEHSSPPPPSSSNEGEQQKQQNEPQVTEKTPEQEPVGQKEEGKPKEEPIKSSSPTPPRPRRTPSNKNVSNKSRLDNYSV